MRRKYFVSWDIIQMYTKNLAIKLLKVNKWKEIIAVSRSGLIPATLLARELNIRSVDTICIISYYYKNLQKNSKIIKIPSIKDSENTLIVDDLSDTGRTAKIIRKIYPKSCFVTIFSKPDSSMLVDYFVLNVPQDTWIEQPWDTNRYYSVPLIQESDNI